MQMRVENALGWRWMPGVQPGAGASAVFGKSGNAAVPDVLPLQRHWNERFLGQVRGFRRIREIMVDWLHPPFDERPSSLTKANWIRMSRRNK